MTQLVRFLVFASWAGSKLHPRAVSRIEIAQRWHLCLARVAEDERERAGLRDAVHAEERLHRAHCLAVHAAVQQLVARGARHLANAAQTIVQQLPFWRQLEKTIHEPFPYTDPTTEDRSLTVPDRPCTHMRRTYTYTIYTFFHIYRHAHRNVCNIVIDPAGYTHNRCGTYVIYKLN